MYPILLSLVNNLQAVTGLRVSPGPVGGITGGTNDNGDGGRYYDNSNKFCCIQYSESSWQKGDTLSP